MKKISILSAFTVFALAVCGCSKDAAENTAPQGTRVSFIGDYATDPGPESRTAVDLTTGKTSWNAGDACGVWVTGNSNPNAQFTNSAEALNIFTGTLDLNIASGDPVWAYYPHSAAATADDTAGRTLTLTLPLEQVQQGAQAGASSVLTAAGRLYTDADGNPLIGRMQFIHQTAGLCFNVYGSLRIASTNPETLKSVSIETESPLKQNMIISDPAVLSELSGTGANIMTVTVEKAPNAIGYAKEEGTKAYLSIPHEAIAVTKITVTTDQGVYTKVFPTPKTVAAVAGKIYPINLNLNTFTVSKNFRLSVPGDHNKWATDSSYLTGRTVDFNTGMFTFNGQYKFLKNSIWYGQSGAATVSAQYYTFGGNNFNNTGNYYVIADTYGANATLVSSVSLPGAWNGWNLESSPTFVYDADTDLWTLSDVKMTAGDEFKVVFNKTWNAPLNRTIKGGGTILPGTPVHLEFDAANNIKMGQSGTYTLTLDLSTYGGTLLAELQ